jgi:hypothetical protein
MTCDDTGRAVDDASPQFTGLRLTSSKRRPDPEAGNTVRDRIGPASAERESITPFRKAQITTAASQGEAPKLFRPRFSARIDGEILAVINAG